MPNTISRHLDNAERVVQILEKLGVLDRVRKFFLQTEPHDILLVGVSGTGKTSFRDHIFGDPKEISRYERTTVVKPMLGKLRGKLINIIDTPGQTTRPARAQLRTAILQAQNSRKLGVINVVAYGYHEGITEVKNAVENGLARKDYLENRRKEEINQLREWVNILAAEGGSAKWLITLVTKSDLWWEPNARHTILTHYITGEYSAALGPAQRLEHSVLPYSSLNKMFYGVVPMSGFYSDAMKLDDHDHLIATILKNCATT
jgi:GTP-binding protein EngB required for normal cell division